MSNPYINPSVKCAVRWYRRSDQRTRFTVDCQEQTGEQLCPFALVFPSTQILPFQLIAGVEGTFGQSAPTGWRIYDLNGVQVENLSAFLLDLAVEQFANPNRDYIILDEPITLDDPLPDGLYEMQITTAGGTYYSETFRVCAAAENCLHKLTWTSCGDIGSQRYAFREFTNIAYFPREKAHIGRAVPEIKQETEEDAASKDVPVLSRKVVRWNMEIEDMPWYLADALTEIPLHDTVTLRLAGETGEDTIDDISATVAWPEGESCLSRVTFSFTADEASLVSGCCDSFDVACPEPCIEADGVFGVHDPVVNDVFLLDRGQYGTFYGIGAPEARDAYGFGNYVACPQRFATTTQTGYEYVYFSAGEWHPAVYILDISGGDCTGTLTVTGNMMGQFGAQFQWSEDLSTWTDIGPVFDSDSLGSGIELTDVPDEANYIRIEMVGSECTAATSQPVASPCIDGVDLTYSTGGLNNIVFDAHVQDDGRVVVGGTFTAYSALTTNRLTRLLSDGTLDMAYRAAFTGGCDGTVQDIAADSSGRIVAVGAFANAGGSAAGGIVRVGTTGAVDATFATGTGLNGTGYGVAILSNGTVIVVGGFTSYNGTAKNRIIGLRSDGAIETGFAVGTGANSQCEHVALCPDGTLIISSNFATQYQGNNIKPGGTATIFRVNADGSFNSVVALSSDPSNKCFNGDIRGITVQPNGKIIVTGEFTNYNGTAVANIARLNADGTLDTAFTTNNGTGFAGATPWTMGSTVLLDGRILVGIYDMATTFDGNATDGLVCLNPDGSFDDTFDIGTGFDGTVHGSIVLGSASALIYGGFSNADGVQRKKVARIIL